MNPWRRPAGQDATRPPRHTDPQPTPNQPEPSNLDAFQQLQASLSTQAVHIKANVEIILNYVEQLGTTADNANLRGNIHDLIQSTRDMSNKIMDGLKLGVRHAVELRHMAAFSDTFREAQESVIAFERALTVNAKRQKTLSNAQVDAVVDELESSLTKITEVAVGKPPASPNPSGATTIPGSVEGGPPTSELEDEEFQKQRNSLLLQMYKINANSRAIIGRVRQLGTPTDDGAPRGIDDLIDSTKDTTKRATHDLKTLATFKSKSSRHKAIYNETAQDLRWSLETFRKVQIAASDRQLALLELEYNDLVAEDLRSIEACIAELVAVMRDMSEIALYGSGEGYIDSILETWDPQLTANTVSPSQIQPRAAYWRAVYQALIVVVVTAIVVSVVLM